MSLPKELLAILFLALGISQPFQAICVGQVAAALLVAVWAGEGNCW